jgi:hypothetical protein
MIAQAVADIIGLISGTLDPDHGEGLVITDRAEDVRPALVAGQTVAWIISPAHISFPAPGIASVEWRPVLLSPRDDDPTDGLDDLLTIVAALETPLGITEATPDAVQLGSGPYWPSIEIAFTTTGFNL